MSPNEVAKALGEAIGEPGLKWITVSDEQLLNGMVAAGMNPSLVKGAVDTNASMMNGVLYEDYNRNKPTLGKVKLKDFVKEFATVFIIVNSSPAKKRLIKSLTVWKHC